MLFSVQPIRHTKCKEFFRSTGGYLFLQTSKAIYVCRLIGWEETSCQRLVETSHKLKKKPCNWKAAGYFFVLISKNYQLLSSLLFFLVFSFSGFISTAFFSTPLPRWVYIWVVAMLSCPKSSLRTKVSTPLLYSRVAAVCLNLCGVMPKLPKPAALRHFSTISCILLVDRRLCFPE